LGSALSSPDLPGYGCRLCKTGREGIICSDTNHRPESYISLPFFGPGALRRFFRKTGDETSPLLDGDPAGPLSGKPVKFFALPSALIAVISPHVGSSPIKPPTGAKLVSVPPPGGVFSGPPQCSPPQSNTLLSFTSRWDTAQFPFPPWLVPVSSGGVFF